jgi:hypothetical protein
MRAFATTVAHVAALVGVLTAGGHAQTLPDDPHRIALALSADVGPYPDAFTVRCGTAPNSTGDGAQIGLGAGVSAIDRPRSMVFVEADVRASVYRGSACGGNPGDGPELRTAVLPFAGTPVMPLVRTLLRAGLEMPPSSPVILRATVGAGMIWNAHTAPVGSVTIGAGTSNPGARFFSELEWDVSRARMTVTKTFFGPDGNITSVTTEVAHPAWMAVRFGVEWPLR